MKNNRENHTNFINLKKTRFKLNQIRTLCRSTVQYSNLSGRKVPYFDLTCVRIG